MDWLHVNSQITKSLFSGVDGEVGKYVQQVSGSGLDGQCPVCLTELAGSEDEGGIVCLSMCHHALHVPCMQALISHQNAKTKVRHSVTCCIDKINFNLNLIIIHMPIVALSAIRSITI
jgi:hypothetical protein